VRAATAPGNDQYERHTVDLELSDDQKALRDTTRRLLAEAAPIAGPVRSIVDGADWTPDRAWALLTDIGALGLLVPADRGGLGCGMVDAAVVAEELGRALYPGPWSASAVSSVRALLAVGSNSDVDDLLAGIAAASTVAAVAVPSLGELRRPSGHGLAMAPAPGGIRLTGVLRQVPGAPHADVVLLVAPDGEGLALYQVPLDGGSVAVTPAPTVDRTTSSGQLTLDGAVAVKLGAVQDRARRDIHDDAIVVRGADALGAASAVLDLAVQHAQERSQFGVPIGSFQAVQHLCVDMYETVELVRGGVLHAAWTADVGLDDDGRAAALRLKSFSDRLRAVAETAIQVLGGVGFTWEHDAHLYLKRLLTWSVALGSADAYRVELGRRLVRTGAAG
jgi:alkylation response protein AidB-like acyl-CoA dehydrogenase